MSAAIAQPGPDAAQASDDGAENGAGPKPYKLSRLRQQYLDYMTTKSAEMEEQREARRYYHGSQHTAEEIQKLNERNQPVVTYNRIVKKINGVCGLVEKLRQDPKGFPRSPNGADGAELATNVLRYVLDANDWRDQSPEIANDGAVEGIGGIEISLEAGDQGDPDVSVSYVDPRDYFYDPRSSKWDFSDATFMGIDKWVDVEAAVDMFPEKADAIRNMMDSSGFGGDNAGRWDEREIKWTSVREGRIRLIEHWYRKNGEWMYCFYSGDMKLTEGISPFVDNKGRTFCRFIMYSNQVDQDDDRYGFCRQMKGPQDEINHRRSKGLHGLNNRRIVMEEGAVEDIERTRVEAAKPDGVVVVNPGGLRFEFDDQEKAAQAAGNLQLLQEAKQEIEEFGPNPSELAANGSSGRAIALLQQAGIADLGPFILRYRGWKVRVYRAIWNTVQKHWTGERWVRVTDDQNLAQFIQVNGVGVDPRSGQPVLVNALGALDVDIILDEGPDQVNSMADAYDTLIALAGNKIPIPPQVIIELSSLPGSVKKSIMGMIQQQNQPDPAQEQAKHIALAGAAAKVDETQARAHKHTAETLRTLQEAEGRIGMPGAKPPGHMAPVTPGEMAFAGASPPQAPMPPQGPPMPPDGVPPGMPQPPVGPPPGMMPPQGP
jgi:hypothetical protein